ncbi:response regulator transcription factor [Pseudomonas mediterranea]|uniref:Two-component system, NarL family, response regulator EvgA n=1 Tax=Pseudomonas mediterranea TaxID=183795 RepID=A0AAX2DB27_9PSED|nr:response regulator transcription factor [Pseudomonas mediterranea]KGU87279.1 DNA-binding protein [Pseudomonas mediterranea CFBP 5447]MBL0843187.1 response regulator transcription factor [Pseudomonas mediterranea]MDU9030801.1 response regulator transcription factor [Pseudomonas mediterranea]UZD99417.1 response regulator transcription factor [Pseudomonas mediterranea]CAH0265012.1 Virulence factors putative positive transcription regulator BvgA [Pseudomonas mediterranea]
MKDVLIVDDHPVIRGALRLICQNEGFTQIRDADGVLDARALIKERTPELVILDLVMNGFDGLDLLVWIMAQYPGCGVLVFTSQDAQHFCNRCISAGARGFVTKKSDLKELTKAIHALKSGYSYFPQMPVRLDFQQRTEQQALESLSTRELSILRMLSMGMRGKDVAESLYLSPKTVSTYKTRLLEKLGLKTLVGLSDFAKRNHL